MTTQDVPNAINYYDIIKYVYLEHTAANDSNA